MRGIAVARIAVALALATGTWAIGLEGLLAGPLWLLGLALAALVMLRLALRPDRKPPGTSPWPYRPAAACRAVTLECVRAYGIDFSRPAELPSPANDIGVPIRLAA